MEDQTQPKSIEQLLTEGFVYSRDIIEHLIKPILLMLALTLLATDDVSLLNFVVVLGLIVVTFYTYFLIITCVDDLAAKRSLTPIPELLKRIDLMLVMENIWLVFRVIITSLFLMIFLILPGLIYIVNRFLAYYILNLDRVTVSESLAKSRQLMTYEPWYLWHGPQLRLTGLMIVFFLLGIGASFFGLFISGLLVLINAVLGVQSLVDFVSGKLFSTIMNFFVATLQSWLVVYQCSVLVPFYRDLELRSKFKKQ